MRRTLLIVTLGAVLPLLLSCGDSDNPVNPNGDPQSYPLATTPDQLMTNFFKAYGERNFEQYRDALGTEFVFMFADDDVESIGNLEPEWNRDDELRATQKMFSNQPGWDPVSREPTPAIAAMNVDAEALPPDWALSEEPRFQLQNAYVRRYQVALMVTLDGFDTPQALSGVQQFFVASTRIEAAGEGKVTVWHLVGWRDEGVRTGSREKSNDTQSWGSMKAVFAP